MKKADFDNQLKKVNKKITSNKTKNVLVQNELRQLQTFDSTIWLYKKIQYLLLQDSVLNLFIVYELDIWSKT